jgi:hypothetical protein
VLLQACNYYDEDKDVLQRGKLPARPAHSRLTPPSINRVVPLPPTTRPMNQHFVPPRPGPDNETTTGQTNQSENRESQLSYRRTVLSSPFTPNPLGSALRLPWTRASRSLPIAPVCPVQTRPSPLPRTVRHAHAGIHVKTHVELDRSLLV